jgi:predicted RNA-binding Zn-ribbon protein involved in translation (DUF1610 family)
MYYSLAPCPKCGADVWEKRGGYKNVPLHYTCLACGMDTLRIRAALRAAEKGT